MPRTVLHLTVGLPGVGKTTLARRIEAETGALRLTPDEWMAPLFGDSSAGGRRDVLEGPLLWVAHRVVRGGLPVVVDFGCWSPDERYAIRDLAERAGADFRLHYLELAEDERRRRAVIRWQETPAKTFEMTDQDHDRFLAGFVRPSADELGYGPIPSPPTPFPGWAEWAADRWPTLPVLGF